MNTAVKEIKEADGYNTSSGGMLNKGVYLAVAIVLLLIFLSWLMPK
jgi:hypothetical protein